jgi:hypothetical protein
MGSFNSDEYTYLEQREPLSTLKHLSWRKCFFEKVTQLSQGNSILDATASNTNVFLSRETCVSSTQLNKPIRNKESLFPH